MSILDGSLPLSPPILANAFFIFLIYRIRFEPQVSTRDFGIVISIRNIISILLASLNCFKTYVNFYLRASLHWTFTRAPLFILPHNPPLIHKLKNHVASDDSRRKKFSSTLPSDWITRKQVSVERHLWNPIPIFLNESRCFSKIIWRVNKQISILTKLNN